MTRRVVATYLLLALVVLVALEVPLGIVNERNQRRDLEVRVERDAVALAGLVEDRLQDMHCDGAFGLEPGDDHAVFRYDPADGQDVLTLVDVLVRGVERAVDEPIPEEDRRHTVGRWRRDE